MNLPFLLFMAVVAIVCAVACWRVWFETAFFSGAALLFLLLGSFLGSWGTTRRTDTTQFLLERTAYRAVVTVNQKEYTFKDAYTMANLDRLDHVVVVTPINAWGFSASSPDRIELVFKEVK